MDYLFAAILLIVLFILFCHYQNNKIDVTHYKIQNDAEDKAFRIAHLSDLHSKPFRRILVHLNKAKPDIICITGDYINDKCRNKDKMLSLAKELAAVAPVYYITGNHERRLACFETLMEELRDAGFHVLRNEIQENEYCAVLGLDENQADFADYKARRNGTFVYKDMSPYFEELMQHSKFRLVLSHFPENFEGIKELNYAQYDFNLQLSGHAHGGQWIIGRPLFSPGQGVFPKYAKGTFGEKPKLIISRGLGNAEFPLRLFNHPEIILIDVTNNGKED